ncbi:hypothetical protein NL676_030111 [Syzygium grande]|nr:hypothetical protein NL676_030111 [Syzygium grande]
MDAGGVVWDRQCGCREGLSDMVKNDHMGMRWMLSRSPRTLLTNLCIAGVKKSGLPSMLEHLHKRASLFLLPLLQWKDLEDHYKVM